MIRIRSVCAPLTGLVPAVLAVSLTIAGTSLAQDTDDDLSRFFGNDERVTVKPITMPWQAIGKIVHASTGFCTGTLVAPDIVLTAAHCMFEEEARSSSETGDTDNEADQVFLWDQPLYFLAGFHEGRFAATSHVADIWVPPEFDINGFLSTYDYDHLDFAFLRLEEPIGETVGWFNIAELDSSLRESLLGPDGPKVSQAGYSADSNRRLTAHIGCRLLRFEENDTVLHECDTMEGDSGSPLFFAQDGQYWMIALESQWLLLGEEVTNGAVDSRAFSQAFTQFAAE